MSCCRISTPLRPSLSVILRTNSRFVMFGMAGYDHESLSAPI
jgi:hypothetical protein